MICIRFYNRAGALRSEIYTNTDAAMRRIIRETLAKHPTYTYKVSR